MSDLPLFTRKADERIAALEAALKTVSDYTGRLEYKLAAEQEKVRVLRVALRKITEANEQSPVKTYQRMEQIAHQALRATAPEQEGE